MENNSEKEKEKIVAITILILVVLVILYLFSLGKINLLSDKQLSKQKLEDRRKKVDEQYKKVTAILERKRQLKNKLDKIVNRVLLGVRIVMVLVILSVVFVLKMTYQMSILDICQYISSFFVLLAIIAFMFLGSRDAIYDLWISFVVKLTLLIYGKYINIERHFERHNNHIKILELEKTHINAQLKEIAEGEAEILEVLLAESTDNNLPK